VGVRLRGLIWVKVRERERERERERARAASDAVESRLHLELQIDVNAYCVKAGSAASSCWRFSAHRYLKVNTGRPKGSGLTIGPGLCIVDGLSSDELSA
jgi:hypothetical protein